MYVCCPRKHQGRTGSGAQHTLFPLLVIRMGFPLSILHITFISRSRIRRSFVDALRLETSVIKCYLFSVYCV